jgi:hypothetical protein
MKSDMDAFAHSFSGDGSVSGENLTVDTASDGWYTAPGEVGMSMSVDSIPPTLPPGAVPDLPFQYEPPDIPGITGLIVLFLADVNGQPIAAGGQGTIVAKVDADTGADPVEATAAFGEFDSTTDILSALSAQFSTLPLSPGARYEGLIGGFPVFSTVDRRDLMAGFSVSSESELDFITGAAIFGVPEPQTMLLLAVAIPLALCWRRERP